MIRPANIVFHPRKLAIRFFSPMMHTHNLQSLTHPFRRVFNLCQHELSHALDVCRMAWMMYLEDEYKTHLKDYRQKKEAKVEVSEQEYRAEIAGQYITDLQTDDADHTEKPYLSADNMLAKKDQFYVTGLLHDIGRVAQYETGEHHSACDSS